VPDAPEGRGTDPVALRSAFLFGGFLRYLRWSATSRFHALRIARPGPPATPPDRPLIVYLNHPSWWDPAVIFLLNDILTPRRAGFGPMDSAALARYGVMRRLGVFGLDPGPRGAAQFLRSARTILAAPDRALWITAEGTFTDARTRPVRLRPGIAHLARAVPEAVILPLALEYTFWNESKPEALAAFGPPLDADPALSVPAWTARLESALETAMDGLAARAMTRDPALFVPLLRGRTGVGGPYDLFRRAASWARLRRFNPGHEP
jgi:1-acyl-sn-glycerol-3-phosphate acyltransferase